MPRSKPFSGKQKKQQLQEKREKKRAQGGRDDSAQDAIGQDALQARGVPEALLSVSLGKSGAHNRLSTVFAREEDAFVRARRIRAAEPLDTSRRGSPLVARQSNSDDGELEHPKGVLLRSGRWTRELLVSGDARKIEEEQFKAWLDSVYSKWARMQLNTFEHNMEVWMQLWHTLATAHVVCIVADVRNPLWHVPRSLYEQITKELRKKLVIVLNKCDLVPQPVRDGWISWLSVHYPDATLVPFSSSGADLSSASTIAARRNALRAARLAHDPVTVGSRIECVTRLLQAAGAPAQAIEEVQGNLRSTIKVGHRRDEAPLIVDAASAMIGKGKGGGRREASTGQGMKAAHAESSGQDDDDVQIDRNVADDSASETKEEDYSSDGEPEASALEQHTSRRSQPPLGRAETVSSTDGDDESEGSNDDLAALAAHLPRQQGRGSGGAARNNKQIAVPPTRLQQGQDGTAASSGEEHSVEDEAPAEGGPIAHGGRIPPSLIIGMVGHPNVGKSSVINAVAGGKKVSVSRTAGHTKHAQTIHIAAGVALLDCPGLVFPHALPLLLASSSASSAASPAIVDDRERAMQECCGVVPLAQVREPYTAVRLLAEYLPLERMYGLPLTVAPTGGTAGTIKRIGRRAGGLPSDAASGSSSEEEDPLSPLLICESLAVKRGKLIAKTGQPDAHAAGRDILYDAQDGVLPLWWMPPSRGEEENSSQ